MCNILIIDDNEKNINKLIDVFLEKNEDGFNFQVFPKKINSDEFSKKIRSLSKPDTINDLYNLIKHEVVKHSIEVIVLDFYLDGQKNLDMPIERTDGYLLLLKIRDGSSKFSNIPIYSYTWAQEQLNIQKGLIGSGKLQGDIIKSDNIADDISDRVLYNIEFEAEKYKRIIETDIVVICALESELDAVRGLSLHWEKIAIGGKTYYKGKLNQYDIIATSENKMGMSEAASLTTRVIDIFNPKYVVMTGIAAGIDNSDGEQNFLDLLMPDYVFNWQSGKYKVDGENGDKELHYFEKDYRSEDTFLKHYNNIDYKELASKSLGNVSFEDVDFRKPDAIQIHNDGMVSGSAVVADKKIVTTKIQERKVNGIDMEAYGVVFACNNSLKGVKSIIIKSICDFADVDKSDMYQQKACELSAQAFYTLFNEYIKEL